MERIKLSKDFKPQRDGKNYNQNQPMNSIPVVAKYSRIVVVLTKDPQT